MEDELKKWIDVQTGLSKLYVHDFKNPISAIAANLSYLEAVLEDVDEDVRGAVADSSLAVRMLLHMLDNFLTISRLESRELLESSPVPLDRFMDESLQKIRQMFTTQEPLLVMSTPAPVEMCFWPMSYARLAVDNLILQSMYNTSASGKVQVGAAVDGRMITVTVTDNGVAIAPEFAPRSFDRDFQMDAKSNEHARYGRALAMYAVGLAAKELGGSIKTERINQYQTFELRLPMEIELNP